MEMAFSKRTGWPAWPDLRVIGGAVGDELEDGVRAEGVVVVRVLVAGQDAVDAGADHLQEGVLGQGRVTGVVQGVGEGPGESDALVELPDGKESGVAGELPRRGLDDERLAEEAEDLRPGGGYTHGWSPCQGEGSRGTRV
jgi:hypothetical protein